MIPQRHDRLIRLFCQHPARADRLVRHLMRRLTSGSPVTPLSDRQVTALPRDSIDNGFTEARIDLLFRAWTTDNDETGFNVLIENKSTDDDDIVLQLMRYRLVIWTHEMQQHGSVRRICTFVIYNGKSKWTAKRTTHGIVDAAGSVPPALYQPDPNAAPDFLVYDIGRELTDGPPEYPDVHALFLALFVCMADTHSDDEARDILCALHETLHSPLPGAALIFPGLLAYIVDGMNTTVDRLLELAPEGSRRWLEESMNTLGQALRDEGEAIGRTKGEAIGRTKGRADTLLRLLERRFGEVPEGTAAQVRAADVEQLDGWLDAVLDADSLDDIFRNGVAH